MLLVLSADAYVWHLFLHHAPLLWSLLYWIPTLLLIVSMIAFRNGAGQWSVFTAAVITLCLSLPKILFSIISVAGRGAALAFPPAAAYFDFAGAAVAVIVCAACVYGVTAGWKRLTVKHVVIEADDLPAAFDGYRIVQISDLHIGTFAGRTGYMRRLVDRVADIDPDLVVFTGDLVNLSADETAPYEEILSGLHARDGVVSILGNHDYCLYKHYDSYDGAARDLERIKECERRAGWRLLLNEHIDIARSRDTLTIIGVENIGRPPFPSQGDLTAAMSGIPDSGFKILLSHDPTHWRDEVLPSTDIRLTLSGHTHAMQLKIGGFSPSSWLYREWGGLYREGRQQLYVSTGAGGNLPFRLGAWPEIVEITLKAAPQHSPQDTK